MSRIAAAPISWGVCEVPGWGLQLSPERVLTEMRQLGFTHTELGSAGWLPQSTPELQTVLRRHELSLLAAFIPLVMHDAEQAETTLSKAAAAAKLLSDSGGTHFNTAPITSVDWQPRHELSSQEWQHLCTMVEEVERICDDHGLTQVIHEHVGCVIETADEVRTLLDSTPSALVVDTGHLAVGGFSPIDLVKQFPERVGLVHLKDTNIDVAERLNRQELTLMEAVKAGLFTTLGQGDLDLAEFITALEASGYRGRYVIEQDCAITGDPPDPGEGPATAVAASLGFLNGLAATL